MTMLRLRKGDEGPALPLTVVRKVGSVPNTAVSWPSMLPSPHDAFLLLSVFSHFKKLILRCRCIKYISK